MGHLFCSFATMKLSLYPYHHQFSYPFRIAHGMRMGTDVVYVLLEHEGLKAWGEATLPPYLPETQRTVIDFISALAASIGNAGLDAWFEKLGKVETNMSAKAALDMALWSMKAQMQGKTVGELFGIAGTYPEGFFTVGVCSKEEMKQRVDYALKRGFERFKLKLNGENDAEIVGNFTSMYNHSFAVDVNSGWKTIDQAEEFLPVLDDTPCTLIEQPFPKIWIEELKEFRDNCSYDLFADESCQRLSDIEGLRDSFDGINIKLMKCGGITEALQMIKRARALEMKVLIGCMSESSVGCTAAAHLTPLADYADLDGHYLLGNDSFEGMRMKDGKIEINPVVWKWNQDLDKNAIVILS